MYKLKDVHTRAIVMIVAAYVIVEVGHRVDMLSTYAVQIIILSLINAMVTAALNLVNGFTGQFCVGQAGFMAIGAYGSAAITTLVFHSASWAAPAQFICFMGSLAFGAILAGMVGYLIGVPTLRLKGDYLAIVTLAFGEVIRAFLRSFGYTGGAKGLGGIPAYSSLFWVFVSAFVAIAMLRNFVFSSYGRACMAIRDSEIAADVMGVDTTKSKILAFTISAAITGWAGGLYAHVLRYLHPDSFSYLKSIDYLVYVYAGGMGSLSGSVVGAICLTVLPEVLRFLKDWRLVLYPLLLIVLMLTRPQGLFGGREFSFLAPPPGYLSRWADILKVRPEVESHAPRSLNGGGSQIAGGGA